MSYVMTPFEVSSKAMAEPAQCRFVHLYPGISLRHSDTMDCIFRVNGQKVTVAISCAALTALRERDRTPLSDQQLVEIAALTLRRTLEQGYDATQAQLDVGEADLRALGKELGFL